MMVLMDMFLLVFHTAFVIFILTGWMHPKTRKLHATAILLTLTAWLLIGLYVGTIGYCPLTDWHWDIKRSLGERHLPHSFIEYLLEKLTYIDFNSAIVDIGTAVGLAFSIFMAWFKNRESKDRTQLNEQRQAA